MMSDLQKPSRRDFLKGSTVAVGGAVLAGSLDVAQAVYAAGREYNELARNDLGDPSVFIATPVVSNGQLLLRSDKALYCIGQ